MSVVATPYTMDAEFKRAGWRKNFDVSGGGHYCAPVVGAPSLGSSPGGLLYFGHWTAPDGASLFQRSNMDRSVTTVVFNPNGLIVAHFTCKTLIDAIERVRDLDLI